MSSEQEIISRQAEEIKALRNQVASLKNQLDWLRKKVFGSMSEKRLPEDLKDLEPTLFDDMMTEAEKELLVNDVKKLNEEQDKVISVKGFERKVRKPIDTSRLEVRVEDVYPDVENRDDYTELEPEITDTLVHVPEQIYIRRVVRHKLVLKSHLQIQNPDRKPFELAPVPAMPLPKCMASESLLADIIIGKFIYHMPFYRVIQKYKELGVVISSSTMNDWYAAACEKLKLLYDLLMKETMTKSYLQVDESTIPVIDNEKHAAVKGYMWCVRAVDENLVYFYYDMGSRSFETARKLLGGYHGTVQTDGYGAYNQFETYQNIQLLGCWAHARRKFCEAEDEDKSKAMEALAFIGKLYNVESDAKKQGWSAEKLQEMREKISYPTICTFEKWMYDTASNVTENSRMGKAIGYTVPLMPRLSRYVRDARYQIDNNLVENAVRPLALGRKNFLFCGNHDSAIRAAVIYSLVSTCKGHAVDPRKWMEDVLVKIPQYENQKLDLRKLLPHNWQKEANL